MGKREKEEEKVTVRICKEGFDETLEGHLVICSVVGAEGSTSTVVGGVLDRGHEELYAILKLVEDAFGLMTGEGRREAYRILAEFARHGGWGDDG